MRDEHMKLLIEAANSDEAKQFQAFLDDDTSVASRAEKADQGLATPAARPSLEL